MNTLNKNLISGLAVILAGVYAHSAIAADATGTASATVLAPLTITENTAMSFGNVSGDSAAATTVVLTTAGATSSADGAYVEAGTGQEGIFDVTGAANAAYSITLPADGAVNLAGPGANMPVNGFNHDRGASPALSAAGADTISVGATLTIGAGQLAGAYSANYTVTVDYQ